MSFTEIYAFDKAGNASLYGETRNAWRGAMAVWKTIEDKYLPPYRLHGTTISRTVVGGLGKDNPAMQIWELADSLKLPIDERIVLHTTFDRCLVKKEHLRHVIDAFNRFEGDTSLPLQAQILAKAEKDPDIIAIGWNQTSVMADTWSNAGGYDDEKDEPIPYNCLTGTDHYWLFEQLVCDENVERWWEELADVPFDDPGPEADMVLAEDWGQFEKGTKREEIWHWFDEHHSRGVAFLMHGEAGQP